MLFLRAGEVGMGAIILPLTLYCNSRLFAFLVINEFQFGSLGDTLPCDQKSIDKKTCQTSFDEQLVSHPDTMGRDEMKIKTRLFYPVKGRVTRGAIAV